MIIRKVTYTAILIVLLAGAIWSNKATPVWPPYPDPTRVEWLGEIDCDKLKPHSGFFGKLKTIVAGKSKTDKLTLPFDILVNEEFIYLTCQTIPALIQVSRADSSFRLYYSDDKPFEYPIALAAGDGTDIYITDSKAGTVFKFDGSKVRPFISDRLERPTGICTNSIEKKIYIVDTGDHTIKIFDFGGEKIGSIGKKGIENTSFNFPTFISSYKQDGFIVNDAMNYQMKMFDHKGQLRSVFGQEGDGPGTFSRPKGLACDSDNHIWVVDNLFDNIQLFDEDGHILLVIGSTGQQPGQFWSPAGIDIYNDTVYVADTFNNRIQVLYYHGENYHE